MLEKGQNVVCDRYAFSGIAYSCAKVRRCWPTTWQLSFPYPSSPLLQGLSYDWCRAPDAGLPSPDLTIFLSLSPEAAAQRGGYGEERYEAVTMQTRVRQTFAQLGSDPSVGRWCTVDAGQPIDKVAQDCLAEAQQVVQTIRSGQNPVGSLFT